MTNVTSLGRRLLGLNLRLRSRDRVCLGRRRAIRRFQAAAEVLRLEGRCMLSGVPIPMTNPVVPLSDIFWNGGPPLNTNSPQTNVPSPSAAGAMKTITLTNNSNASIYPFIRGENTGKDPNATPMNAPYDPQDLAGHEFRLYIGYQTSTGEYLGLPKRASLTFQVPLVLWDGDNFFISTDSKSLTANTSIYNFDPNAMISIAGTTPSGTTPANTTTWVTNFSKYPAGDKPILMFYYSGTPITVLRAAPAQLSEWTFRDPYLTQFLTDPLQTFPLVNYDVSYVNNLTAPVSIEASNVPITVGDRLSTKTPPDYYGYQDYGWNPTNLGTTAFETPVADFVRNTKEAAIGDYFGGKGWPKYYNPDAADVVIPSGANVYLDSPLTDARSPFDGNRYLLTSSGSGQIGTILSAFPDGAKKLDINPAEAPSKIELLRQGMEVAGNTPGIIQAGTTITSVHVTGSDDKHPYVMLSKPTGQGGASGEVITFTAPLKDYAATDITNLWYSWANYYVRQYENFQAETAAADLNYYVTPAGVKTNQPLNEITLTTAPLNALAPGMTVSDMPAGTTILSITDPTGKPITTAQAAGDNLYLSRIPDDSTPQSQVYIFGRPLPIESDPAFTKPYALTFSPAAQKTAVPFAGAVYEAMAAEASVVQPTPLPYSAAVVGQVINFYAKLPGYQTPNTGPILVGNVRDVVKSILRGVWNFIAVPNQLDWYPKPSEHTGGKDFNVYNLNPYVWFVHKVVHMSGYAFSVDDDVANPAAAGPVLSPDSTPGNPVISHVPNNLQIGFGGINGFGNQNEWFPTIPWGRIDTTATIVKVGGDGVYKNDYMVTLTGPKEPNVYLTQFNQINNPGPGEFGAFISAPGFITRGTTLIFKGPNGADKPQIVLSEAPIKTTDKPIPVAITAGASPPLG